MLIFAEFRKRPLNQRTSAGLEGFVKIPVALVTELVAPVPLCVKGAKAGADPAQSNEFWHPNNTAAGSPHLTRGRNHSPLLKNARL
jgi:hypothetical protein